MYEEGTILVLKEQREPTITEIEVTVLGKNGKPTTKTEVQQVEEEFPYNRVKVIGPSFIRHIKNLGMDAKKEPYTGQDAQGVIITPAGGAFGATIDEPYGKLRRMYDIAELPENTFEAPKVTVHRGPSAVSGPTPEEVFGGTEPVDAPRTAANPVHSPLPDPRPDTPDVSPLGDD